MKIQITLPSIIFVALIVAAAAGIAVGQPPSSGQNKRPTRTLASEDLLPTNQPAAGEAANVAEAWYNGAGGYAQAEREQQRTGAPFIVYFRVDWCGYCRSLERNILATDEVKEYLSHTVKVLVNPEAGEAEADLARRYGVRGFPSFFVSAGTNEPPVKITPYKRAGDGWTPMSPADFVRACQRAVRAQQ